MRYDYAYYQGGLLKEKKASGKVLISYEYDSLGKKISQTDLTGKCTLNDAPFLAGHSTTIFSKKFY